MKKPEVSVVLAVWNEDKYLGECLKSLANQRGVSYEVVVVDDGSAKRIKKQKVRIKDETFRLYRIKHSGTAKARNFGARKTKGEMLVFVDGDMRFAPDFLARLTKPIRQGKTKGTFSTEEFVANWDNVWARCWNWENGLPDKRRINPKRTDMVKDFRAILKSEFAKVGGFDDIGYTDTWTLSEKLNYRPQPVKARYWHYNPQSLHEVFRQAAWIGGRRRRFGVLGKIAALLRTTIPISVGAGLLKAAYHKELRFVLFKIIYDLGIFTGIIGSL